MFDAGDYSITESVEGRESFSPDVMMHDLNCGAVYVGVRWEMLPLASLLLSYTLWVERGVRKLRSLVGLIRDKLWEKGLPRMKW